MNPLSVMNFFSRAVTSAPPPPPPVPVVPAVSEPDTNTPPTSSEAEAPGQTLQCLPEHETEPVGISMPDKPSAEADATSIPQVRSLVGSAATTNSPVEPPVTRHPPIYTVNLGANKPVPFPEQHSLQGSYWQRHAAQMEQTHGHDRREIYRNGIPMGALRDQLGKFDADGDHRLNLDEACHARLLSGHQKSELLHLAKENGLKPSDSHQVDAVALGRALQAKGVTLSPELTGALSDLEISNHYLAQTEVSPDAIVFQADPEAKAVSPEPATYGQYREKHGERYEQDTAVRSKARADHQQYQRLTGDIRHLQRVIAREKDPDKKALAQASLDQKQQALADLKKDPLGAVYFAGGTDVATYRVGDASPEAKADRVKDIFKPDYHHAQTGCAAMTDLVHTVFSGHEVNVQQILEQIDDPKLYGADAKAELSPGVRDIPFGFVHDERGRVSRDAEGKRVPNPELLKLFDPETGSIKPGMVLFINSDPNMRLNGESESMGEHKFGSSDRHWFTYLGEYKGKHLFVDQVGQKRTLDQMMGNFEHHSDNPKAPMVLHTVMDFYAQPGQRAEFKRFADELVGYKP